MWLRSVVMPEGMVVSLDDCYYAQLVLLRNNLVALMVCTVVAVLSYKLCMSISHVMLMQVTSTRGFRVCFPCRFLRSQWVDRFS